MGGLLRFPQPMPAILTNLSVTLLQQGKRADACGFAAEAVAADPRNVEALLVLIAADLKCPLSRQVLGGRVADIAKATLTPACRRPFEAAAAFT